MRLIHKLIFLVGLFSVTFSVKSQNDSTDTNFLEKGVGLAEDVIDLVTWENKRHVISVFPAAGYSPRTGLEIGVMPVWKVHPKNKGFRPTTLASSFQISTKGMYEAKLDLISYMAGDWMVWSKMQYLFLPDEFFGLGNGMKNEPYSQYDLNSFTFSSDIAKGINDIWFLGLRLDLNSNSQENIDGDLLNESIPGYKGGWANGLGPILVFDKRDDVLYPSKGWLIMTSHLWYGGILGSQYNYRLSSLDVRHYFPIIKNNSVLASQLVINSSDGNVPFYKMPGIGGKNLLRGIPHPYKYIDKSAWYAQAEWRQKVWWRIGAVAFVGAGKVMPDLHSSWFTDLHAVGGIGMRFQALPKDGLNFRVDYGFSNHNESGFFLTIREAF